MTDQEASRRAGDGGDGDSDPSAGQPLHPVAELSLGGGGQAIPYPALALDPDASGFWGWVDRATERLTSLLNPILVKEARQSLKSKQFLITFFCLLAASCAWTIMGIVFNAPDVYYIPTGDSMMIGYFLILSVSMFAFVPLVAFRSLAAELDEGTYEMLAITRLSAWRIVSGKMNSAVLQMLIYFSALVPCLAFCYLLRGIGLLTIVLVVAIIFITAMVLTALALVLSTLARAGRCRRFCWSRWLRSSSWWNSPVAVLFSRWCCPSNGVGLGSGFSLRSPLRHRSSFCSWPRRRPGSPRSRKTARLDCV
ncbi:MAG: ABC transporter permease [Phycisphaera sp. RhM]|nr:ABC transporter permease [Phycisphaera sp. RhM]